METVFYVIKTAAFVFLDVLLACMMARAVMSWLGLEEENNRFVRAICAITDTVTWPVRTLFDRFGWFEGSPLDVPFIVTVIILALLSYACGF